MKIPGPGNSVSRYMPQRKDQMCFIHYIPNLETTQIDTQCPGHGNGKEPTTAMHDTMGKPQAKC